jgi:hypothetical protein
MPYQISISDEIRLMGVGLLNRATQEEEKKRKIIIAIKVHADLGLHRLRF